MPAWVASIVSAIFNSILEYAKLWYDEEKAATDAWNAKSLESKMKSIVDADKATLRIKEAKPIMPVETPAAWNTGVSSVLLMAAVLILSSGCLFTRYVQVPSKMPIIEAPERPNIPEIPVSWSERENILKDYALTLEARVKAYNDLAHASNKEQGYE